MSKYKKELVGTYRVSSAGTPAGDMASIVFRKAGTVEDTDVCVTTHEFAVDITTKLRTLKEKSAYMLAEIKSKLKDASRRASRSCCEAEEFWDGKESAYKEVLMMLESNQINCSQNPDPLLAECVELLKGCLSYWNHELDKEEMYDIADRAKTLLARCEGVKHED